MKISPSLRSKLIKTLAVVCGLGSTLTAGHAAAIVWDPVQTISDDTDVFNLGTSLQAFNFGVTTDVTVNGVNFIATNINDNITYGVGEGALQINSPGTLASFSSGSTSDPFSSLSFDYQTLLGATNYTTSATMTFTLTNLTVGQEYLVQIWTNDSRSGISGFVQTYTSGNTSGGANTNVAGAEGGVGQFVTGSFVADSSSQVINLNAQGPPALVYTALQLQAVPEPVTASMLLVGGVVFGLSGRIYRRRSGSES